MNYSTYLPVDVVNGEGTRCTLFVSGCNHKCEGCYNEITWNKNFGFEFTQEMEDQVIKDLQDEEVPRAGISLSGGDPLFGSNLKDIVKLIQRIKGECPGKNIWLWTGYTLIDLEKNKFKSQNDNIRWEIVQNVDVLIDGKFEQDKADPELYWRGSSNQIIHRFY